VSFTHPAILETAQALGETTLIADAAQIVDLCRYLKDTEKFVRLSGATAVDWHPAEPRFEVVYHLHSIEPNQRLRVKIRVPGTNPEVDSVTGVWRGADWYEREMFDLFGIGFRNHPNLQRILMPLDWEGHPLRKDYPTHGYKYDYAARNAGAKE
jgi:NADH-quinone oxidoreductase subunit C